MRSLCLLFATALIVTIKTSAQMAEPQPFTGQVTTGVTAIQDSSFQRALALKVTARCRFQEALRESSAMFELSTALAPTPSVWERAMANMAMITPEIAAPTSDQVMSHKLNLQNATYVPGVLLYPMGSGNLQIGLGSIGRFLGIVEDVSPRLVYSVLEPSEVRITIYSASALQARLLYKGIQRPGSYSIEWNGNDDTGHEVVRGDYVAEIAIGQDRIIRKRIVWPEEK